MTAVRLWSAQVPGSNHIDCSRGSRRRPTAVPHQTRLRDRVRGGVHLSLQLRRAGHHLLQPGPRHGDLDGGHCADDCHPRRRVLRSVHGVILRPLSLEEVGPQAPLHAVLAAAHRPRVLVHLQPAGRAQRVSAVRLADVLGHRASNVDDDLSRAPSRHGRRARKVLYGPLGRDELQQLLLLDLRRRDVQGEPADLLRNRGGRGERAVERVGLHAVLDGHGAHDRRGPFFVRLVYP